MIVIFFLNVANGKKIGHVYSMFKIVYSILSWDGVNHIFSNFYRCIQFPKHNMIDMAFMVSVWFGWIEVRKGRKGEARGWARVAGGVKTQAELRGNVHEAAGRAVSKRGVVC